jgi:hypothetical protein
VNHSLEVGVLDRAADLDEERDALPSGELVGVAVIGDGCAPHQLHDKERAATLVCARIVHLGDGLMRHDREGLPLGLEPREDIAVLEASPQHLHRHTTVHGRCLLGLVHDTHPALA